MAHTFPTPSHHVMTSATTRNSLLRMTATAITSLVVMTSLLHVALGHGRLMDPPARNSMWRLGFDNPVNYNDNELYCGGRMVQWIRNSGKCGVCGDAYHKPRDHEAGGKYANGVITRHFRQGDVMPITVHLTANHQGWFEIRVCPVNDAKVVVTQDCLDRHVLSRVEGEGGGVQYPVPKGKYNAFFNYSVQLPPDLTCSQCVVQWKYRTGNTWDKDDNSGVFCLGCGPQEEFYNCADIAIMPDKNAKHKREQKKAPLKPSSPAKTVPRNKIPQQDNGWLKQEKKYPPKIDREQSSRKKTGKVATQNLQENMFTEKEKELERKRQEVKGVVGRGVKKPREDPYSWRAGSAFDWNIVTRRPPRTHPTTTTTTTTTTAATTTTTTSRPKNPFTPPKRFALNHFAVNKNKKRPRLGQATPAARKSQGEGRTTVVESKTTAGPESAWEGRNADPSIAGSRGHGSVPGWLVRLADASQRRVARRKATVSPQRVDARTTHNPFSAADAPRDRLRQSLWRHLRRSKQKKRKGVIRGNLRKAADRDSRVRPTETTSTCSTSVSTAPHHPTTFPPRHDPTPTQLRSHVPQTVYQQSTMKSRARDPEDNFFTYSHLVPYVEDDQRGFARGDFYPGDNPDLYPNRDLQFGQRPGTELFQAVQPVTLTHPVPRSEGGGWWQGYSNTVWTSLPQQQALVRRRLQCRAVVQLGGGMDAWCAANCNANYCPASMCVCRTDSLGPSPYKVVQARDTTWIQPYRQVSQPGYPTRWRPLQLPITVKTTESRSIFASPENVFEDSDRVGSPFVATYSPFVRQDPPANTRNVPDISPGKEGRHVTSEVRWGRKTAAGRASSSDSKVTTWRADTADRSRPGNDVTHWKRKVEEEEEEMVEEERGRDNIRDRMGGRGRRRGRKSMCRATGMYTGVSHYDTWCRNNCAQAMCPLFICTCHAF